MNTPDAVASARCSDADRNAVADLLGDAYADGRLTSDEHHERLDALWEATTFGELEPLTRDLLATTPLPVPASRPMVVDATRAATSPATITSMFGDIKRTGLWRLNRVTRFFTLMGDALFDLRQATLDADYCRITVTSVMGDLVLIVPDGVTVIDSTHSVLGDSTTEGLSPAPPDGPCIEVTGFRLMGDIKICGPGSRKARRLDRRQQRRDERERRLSV